MPKVTIKPPVQADDVVITMTVKQAKAVAKVLARHCSTPEVDTFGVYCVLSDALEAHGLR